MSKRIRNLKLRVLEKIEKEVAAAKAYYNDDLYTIRQSYRSGEENERDFAAKLEALVAELRNPFIPSDDAEEIRLTSLYGDVPVDEFGFSPRLSNALKRWHIYTIAELLRWDSEYEAENRGPFRNVGTKTTRELVHHMREMGFKNFGKEWF